MQEKTIIYIGIGRRTVTFGIIIGSLAMLLGLVFYYLIDHILGLLILGLGSGVVITFLEIMQNTPRFSVSVKDGKVQGIERKK